MDSKSPSVPLEDGLNVSEILRGSILRINIDYDETTEETEKAKTKAPDCIGKPVKNLRELETTMTTVDENGLVKKKILEEGGGLPLTDEFTVSIAFSGYWEDQPQPFDVRSVTKPLVIDLKDHNLLPGLEIAVKSMLVGEASMFLFSYKVMYGELGLPPRIKPKEDCVFYIKLIKSIYTPKNGKINLKEPNMFERVHHEARMLMSSGIAMHKANNICMAASLFKKAVLILQKCRLADENEEKNQEKLLIKLYLNLAICYNDINQPLKACTACNELNRLDSLWNNHKALFQNAKALRMIGQFNAADKRLKRALKLCPDSERIKAEQNLLYTTRESLKSNKLCALKFISEDTLRQEFKNEVDTLLKTFKANNNLCRLNLPPNLNKDEMKYVKEACIRENLFLSNTQNLAKNSDNADVEEMKLFLDKDKNCSTDIFTETVREDKSS